jgi:protein-L-isoaspartate(D-aspartate) O-methyltransferase
MVAANTAKQKNVDIDAHQSIAGWAPKLISIKAYYCHFINLKMPSTVLKLAPVTLNGPLERKQPMNIHVGRDFRRLRHEMVERAIFARGVRSELVLDAVRKVPREQFLPQQLREFAYDDSPLPIEAGQTISQPYIVALMVEALALQGGERVLEIGAGSGYAAAVLAEIADEVYTVERIGQLAEKAAVTLSELGYHTVHVLHGDGTKGWPEHAPYDGIIVAAGGPKVPESLKEQLKIGGRLVIPVGRDPRVQELVRVTRISESEYRREDLADVRFVPLVGEEGWAPAEPERRRVRPVLTRLSRETLAEKIASDCEPFASLETVRFDRLLERIGDAKVVLLGEASHGTSEFYRIRDRISRELIISGQFR